MTFASREDAGRRLGRRLREAAAEVDQVAGLPRGGVVVAAEVARELQRPLQVLLVRKLGHPRQREFAVGALAEGGVVLFDEAIAGVDPEIRVAMNEVIQEEEERLKRYQRKFQQEPRSELNGRSVLLVDDGLATGATMEAAVLSARRQGARKITVAAPVASTQAVTRLTGVAHAIVCLVVDPDFDAVGSYYQTFPQTTDEEVLALLHAAHRID